jgi:plastocyanin
MRLRVAVVLSALILVSTAAVAKDVYLTIGGSVGNFRTDTRVFNPSATKTITIRAAFLEAGSEANHPDNNGVGEKTFTIAPRAMSVFDDVVSSLFQITGKLGAIRFVCEDDFVATQRIYANETTGTLGQFVPGLSVGEASPQGVVLQIKATGSRGTRGTFRTNIGFVNPANATTTVNARLYDRNNAQVGAIKVITMKPFGVISPGDVVGLFNANANGDAADRLRDAYMSYDATNPIYAYASVLDNGTEDPTYVPHSTDSGTPINPPQNAERTFDVTMVNWAISFSPDPGAFKVGEKITLRIKSNAGIHGFTMFDGEGGVVVPDGAYSPITPLKTVTFTVAKSGDYTYFCTQSNCGEGHGSMAGIFQAANSGIVVTPE